MSEIALAIAVVALVVAAYDFWATRQALKALQWHQAHLQHHGRRL